LRRLIVLSGIACSGCAQIAAAFGFDPDKAEAVGQAVGHGLQAVGGIASGTPYGATLVAVGVLLVWLSKSKKEKP